MRIRKIFLENFKRFTKLEVQNIPDASKLVLLIGSNGSGKSSLFDAFGFINSAIKGDNHGEVFFNYYKKQQDKEVFVSLNLDDNKSYAVSSSQYESPALPSTSFYGRTSFRQIPRLTRTSLGQGGNIDFEKDTDRSRFFIERDARFENDVEKVTEVILKDLFRSGASNEQIREKYIHPINNALTNIFGEGNGTRLQLIEIIPPLEGKVAQITFRKGASEIHYDLLSAGEKEVFNLLLNLLTRMPLYQNTIYFFDEIDLHLNTKLQFGLLKEITENWIPENCQLWTATHSLGFIEYARQADHASIVDFDDLDFDLPQVLVPVAKEKPEIYEIAVGKEFLPALFRQMEIYFVENKDRDYYASVGIQNAVFVSDNNRNNVFHKVRTTNYMGIVDRDFLSDDDMFHIRHHYPMLKILQYYSIENYMYHPENLEEYYKIKGLIYDKENYIASLTEAKNNIKDVLILELISSRLSYSYFGEPEFNGTSLQKRFKNHQENRDQAATIQGYLNSNEFEIFYKALPMKNYCTSLVQRQHISKTELVKTEWFKREIQGILQ